MGPTPPRAMESMTPAEALVGVAMCAAYADGAMAAEENEEFTEQLASVRALRGMDERSIRDAMVKANGIARRDGDTALLVTAAAALPAELRATAFYLAAELTLADGDFASEERAFVETLRRALGVPDDVAARIIDVIGIRHRA